MTAKADFKMVPGQSELDRIERDLRFHRVANESPKVLTFEQIAAFNRDGYIRGVRIFSGAEIGDIRGYFDDLLARVIAAGGDSYSISTAHAKYGRVYDILTDKRIVACVKDLLGADVVAWGSHFFCKMPHDGKAVAWHQDASYWPLTPSKAVTAWLAVDDANFGHLTYRPSDSTEHNVLNQTIDNVEQYGTEACDELNAGEVSIHSDLLLHGSEANNSDRRRCGLTLRYCSAEVRAHMDWNQKGVIVSGSDPSGHWANRARPENE